MKTAIYCGSFDPVHKGHEMIAKMVLDGGYADKLVIVPTMDYWDKNGLSPLKDRIAMLKMVMPKGAMIDEEHNSIFSTNELFLTYGFKHPDESLALVLGGDNLEHFEKWINYRDLLKYDFIITCRKPYDEEYVRERMRMFGKDNYVLLPLADMPISSSAIRANITSEELVLDLIDKRVYEYIKEKALYLR